MSEAAPRRNGGPPVMIDVARLAGVSHQTVSRVINDSPNVSAVTRERVLTAMAALGYRRNAAARALATQRSGVLGVLAFDTEHLGPVRTMWAVERAARTLGLGVMIAVADDPSDPIGATGRALDRLYDRAVEGIVAIAPQEGAVAELAARDLMAPLVLVTGAVGTEGSHAGLTVVAADQYGGAAAATTHLLGLGHPTVHHIAGPANWLDARRRRAGWTDTLRAGSATVPVPVAGDWTPASGHRAMMALLATDPGLTAVFAANDQMAVGALSALRSTGRRIPDDVAVVGFDDTPEAAFHSPPLTSVAQDFDEVGRRAADALLRSAAPSGHGGPATRSDPEPGLVPTRLVVRASSQPDA